MRIFLFALILIFGSSLMAQVDSSGYLKKDSIQHYAFEANLFAGKIVKNYPNFPQNKTSFLCELGYFTLTDGQKEWQQFYKYPQVGISLVFAAFGNHDVLGESISVLPNISFFLKRNSKFYGQLKLGMGFAFLNKPYNKYDNPDNIVIGSHITNISALSLNICRNISKKMVLGGGISVFHYSNGHYQLPNVGLNLPCINISFKYMPNHQPEKLYFQKPEKPKNRILFNSYAGVGFHEFGNSTGPTNGTKYPIYIGSFYLSKRYNSVSNVQAGVYTNYYTSFYDYIVTQEFYSDKEIRKSFTVVAFLGHEYLFGRIGFIVQGGIYAYNPFKRDYFNTSTEELSTGTRLKLINTNKLGMQYYFTSPMKSNKHKLFVGIFIKANLGQADFFEMGAGYTF
jgi:hypothetical protein